MHRQYSTYYNKPSQYLTQRWSLCIQIKDVNYQASSEKVHPGSHLFQLLPVSNLSFLSMHLEKCAMACVNEHCNLYKLLPDYQSAYCNGYSC